MDAAVRIYVILVRNAERALVFRRGPSKQVLLIAWNTANDTFEHGQWFKGRIYERRCDLSPAGDKLVYFAATHKPPYGTWTAVSKPPYLTALALWPHGDPWGGGGSFESDAWLAISHGQPGSGLADSFSVPEQLRVTPWQAVHPGMSIERHRMFRDGWALVTEGSRQEHGFDAPVWITFDPAITYQRARPPRPRLEHFVLRMRVIGIKEVNGPWELVEYDLHTPNGTLERELGRLDWADWDRNGDLLFARDGQLFRWTPDHPQRNEREPRALVDLRGLSFREQEAPDWAKHW